MGKKNNRRRKFRPNQQMRRNPKTGKVEKFEGRKPRVEKPKEEPLQPQQELTPGEQREQDRKNHKGTGFIPDKPKPRFRPCVCEGIDLELTNKRLLDLLKFEKRAYNEDSGTNTYLISLRFRMQNARHMRHFRKFLKDEGISFIEV
tara:strand:+ start:26 stop:463 length:438 start_codon:yes stop_codon:yes gene_type:complete